MHRIAAVVIFYLILSSCERRPELTKTSDSIDHQVEIRQDNPWPTIKKHVLHHDFQSAAKMAVDALKTGYSDRSYGMWKWWEETFGQKSDYMTLSKNFGHALFEEFDKSDIDRRKIIADIFSRPHMDLSISGDKFRELVESK